MVHTLRAVGVTHASLGNHEADLKLNKLERRLADLSKSVTILNSNILGQVANPRRPKNVEWLQSAPYMHRSATVVSPCGRVTVGLCGLMSDEDHMFRDGTFRGAKIRNVCTTVDEIYAELVPSQADVLIPVTHQFLKRDQELALHMLSKGMGNGLIIGGHEHVPLDERVELNGQSVRILKAGCEASAMDLIDLTFDDSGERPVLAEVEADLVEMKDYEPSAVISKIVDSHLAMLTSMDNEDILNADPFLPPGVTLSSIGSRYRQTTVGGILCMAIKEELEVDVAIINGATIKGNDEYSNSSISYAQLKKELPFPTKMVVVPMRRWQLHDAIHFSRTQPPSDDPQLERKGYLQVDLEFDRLGFHTGGQDDDLMVALPRNLMNGFCNIVPLMELGQGLKEQGYFPGEDDFIPAMNLVIRHFSKERWYEIVSDRLSFNELDRDSKGFLTREDVRSMLTKATGHRPADFVVDDMIAAIDADDNGVIDQGEFSHLLAEMEREHGSLIRFD